MTDSAAIRVRLDDERDSAQRLLTSLTRDFTDIVEASTNANADDEHDPEGSTIAFERSQVSTLIEQARDRLEQVEAALARLDDGSYGTCEVCGVPIPDGRLQARPAARTCVACA